MAVTPLPFLDRTAVTFKADTDRFFGEELPQFSIEVNTVAQQADSSAATAVSAKNTAVSASDAAVAAKNLAVPAADAAVAAKNAAVPAAQTATTKANEAAASAQRAEDAAAGIGAGVVTSVNSKTPTSGNVVLVKADIGLGSVDNTPDMDKPVSTAQAAAIATGSFPSTGSAKTGQALLLAADKSKYWGYVGDQIGDLLPTARNPGSLYLPADGSIRLQSAYPLLFANVGLIGGSIATAWSTVSSITGGAPKASRAGTVIVAGNGANYGRSTDRGKTFSPVTSGLSGSSVVGLNTNQAGTWIGVTNATSPSRLVRSADDGVTWAPITIPTIAAGGTWKKPVYVGNLTWLISANYGDSLLRSTDDGLTWNPVAHGFGGTADISEIASNEAGVALIASSNVVKRSTDYGATWNALFTAAAGVTAIANDRVGNWLLSGATPASNFYRSKDDAASFTLMSVTGISNSVTSILMAYDLAIVTSGSGGTAALHTISNFGTPTLVAAGSIAAGGLSEAGATVIIAQSTTANSITRSTEFFTYDTATQFALPNPATARGVTNYIKALEAA